MYGEWQQQHRGDTSPSRWGEHCGQLVGCWGTALGMASGSRTARGGSGWGNFGLLRHLVSFLPCVWVASWRFFVSGVGIVNGPHPWVLPAIGNGCCGSSTRVAQGVGMDGVLLPCFSSSSSVLVYFLALKQSEHASLRGCSCSPSPRSSRGLIVKAGGMWSHGPCWDPGGAFPRALLGFACPTAICVLARCQHIPSPGCLGSWVWGYLRGNFSAGRRFPGKWWGTQAGWGLEKSCPGERQFLSSCPITLKQIAEGSARESCCLLAPLLFA